jgi:hypothetical protein
VALEADTEILTSKEIAEERERLWGEDFDWCLAFKDRILFTLEEQQHEKERLHTFIRAVRKAVACELKGDVADLFRRYALRYENAGEPEQSGTIDVPRKPVTPAPVEEEPTLLFVGRWKPHEARHVLQFLEGQDIPHPAFHRDAEGYGAVVGEREWRGADLMALFRALKAG